MRGCESITLSAPRRAQIPSITKHHRMTCIHHRCCVLCIYIVCVCASVHDPRTHLLMVISNNQQQQCIPNRINSSSLTILTPVRHRASFAVATVDCAVADRKRATYPRTNLLMQIAVRLDDVNRWGRHRFFSKCNRSLSSSISMHATKRKAESVHW